MATFAFSKAHLSAQMVNVSTGSLAPRLMGPNAPTARSLKMVFAWMRSPPFAPKELPSTRPVPDASQSRHQAAQMVRLLETDNALQLPDLSAVMVVTSTRRPNPALLSRSLNAHPRRNWTTTSASILVSCSVTRVQFSPSAILLVLHGAVQPT
jgi:hypothetical protein